MGKEPLQQGNWRWNGREWVDVTRERTFPWRMVAVVAAAVLGVAILFYGGALLFDRLGRLGGGTGPATSTSTTSPSARSSPRPSASASPSAVPPAPASSAAISSVAVALNGACAAGSSCALEVTVSFPGAGSAEDFAWSLQATDACTGVVTSLGNDGVTAQAGWNHVIGDRTVTLPPARGPLRLAAVTTAPDRVASPPLQVGSGSC